MLGLGCDRTGLEPAPRLLTSLRQSRSHLLVLIPNTAAVAVLASSDLFLFSPRSVSPSRLRRERVSGLSRAAPLRRDKRTRRRHRDPVSCRLCGGPPRGRRADLQVNKPLGGVVERLPGEETRRGDEERRPKEQRRRKTSSRKLFKPRSRSFIETRLTSRAFPFMQMLTSSV